MPAGPVLSPTSTLSWQAVCSLRSPEGVGALWDPVSLLHGSPHMCQPMWGVALWGWCFVVGIERRPQEASHTDISLSPRELTQGQD